MNKIGKLNNNIQPSQVSSIQDITNVYTRTDNMINVTIDNIITEELVQKELANLIKNKHRYGNDPQGYLGTEGTIFLIVQ